MYPMVSEGGLTKVKLVEGMWQEEKLTWLNSCEKFFAGKKMENQSYWLGNDGYLYAGFSHFGKDSYDVYLFQIDETSGTFTPVNLGGESAVT